MDALTLSSERSADFFLNMQIFRHNCGAQYHPKKAKLNVQQTIQYCFFAGTIGMSLHLCLSSSWVDNVAAVRTLQAYF